MIRTAVTASFVLAALAAAGCFDVHTVDTGPLVIDDFDDGDLEPADPEFDHWGCLTFNPSGNGTVVCNHDAGNGTPYAAFLGFTIVDPMDSFQQHGGASLQTTALKPVDFSRFTEIVFSDKLESGSPALPSDARVYVELGCTTVPDANGVVDGTSYLAKRVDCDTDWQTVALMLENVPSPDWMTGGIQGGPIACLRRVDRLRFTVDAQLADGHTGTGTLHVDGISLQ